MACLARQRVCSRRIFLKERTFEKAAPDYGAACRVNIKRETKEDNVAESNIPH